MFCKNWANNNLILNIQLQLHKISRNRIELAYRFLVMKMGTNSSQKEA
jgi:hypothetical protein